MEKTEKLRLLEKLWYNRNPCHDRDADGNDRFWETVMCVFNDYEKALTLPYVTVPFCKGDYLLKDKCRKWGGICAKNHCDYWQNER